jgi:outer membrane cobalamin receptor
MLATATLLRVIITTRRPLQGEIAQLLQAGDKQAGITDFIARLGRYDTSATLDEVKQYNVQWANTVDVGHGNVGAGIDVPCWPNCELSSLRAAPSRVKSPNFCKPVINRPVLKQYNVQWANTVDVGHGNVGAGIDWQKQTTEPGTNYCGYSWKSAASGRYPD